MLAAHFANPHPTPTTREFTFIPPPPTPFHPPYSSIGHFIQAPRQGVLFDDLEAKTEYDPFARYGQSKLCNLLFSTELNLRMKEEQKPVIAMALNPGFIAATGLIQHTTVSSALKFACNAISRPGGVCASLQEWPKSVEQGVFLCMCVVCMTLCVCACVLLGVGEWPKSIQKGMCICMFVLLFILIPRLLASCRCVDYTASRLGS